MLIENSLSDAIRFFHIDALSSTVGSRVDFDMALLVIASGLYRLLARHMRGYADAQARQIFRDLVDLPADVEITANEVCVQFHRRSHLCVFRSYSDTDSGLNSDRGVKSKKSYPSGEQAVAGWRGSRLRWSGDPANSQRAKRLGRCRPIWEAEFGLPGALWPRLWE